MKKNNNETSKKTSLGLAENLEGLLCYSLGWITGVLFLILEKENKFVRFHAMQSLITFLALFIISLGVGSVPFVGWFISTILAPITFILWLLLMYKAYQGEKYKLPIVGDFAEREISK